MASLDARLEARKLAELYKEDPRQSSVNILLLGEKGTGKTHILKTARKPVHLDSFDPGGSATLRAEILQGDIVADTRYENEDPLDPKQYKLWQYEFEKRRKGNYFDSFGTYCLDSSTLWLDAIGYYILKIIDRKGQSTVSHVGEPLKWNRDYRPMRNEAELRIREILTLPCDVVITGHLVPATETQIIDGELVEIKTGYDLAAIGQGRWRIPVTFSDVWVALATPRAGKLDYRVLTGRKGLYTASTRLGSGGRFDIEEIPDIKYLLKKAGWPHEDRPKLY